MTLVELKQLGVNVDSWLAELEGADGRPMIIKGPLSFLEMELSELGVVPGQVVVWIPRVMNPFLFLEIEVKP